MLESDITFEAQSLLKLIYALYRSKRNEGKGRTEANYFSSSDEIKRRYLNHMSSDDVADLFFELAFADYIAYTKGDDVANNIRLTYKALVFCENKFRRDMNDLLEWLSSIKGIFLFILQPDTDRGFILCE